jgi:hypothetical protein
MMERPLLLFTLGQVLLELSNPSYAISLLEKAMQFAAETGCNVPSLPGTPELVGPPDAAESKDAPNDNSRYYPQGEFAEDAAIIATILVRRYWQTQEKKPDARA